MDSNLFEHLDLASSQKIEQYEATILNSEKKIDKIRFGYINNEILMNVFTKNGKLYD
jgi:hypothetical protein